jgi:8-oxo-dGTP diphosphatase
MNRPRVGVAVIVRNKNYEFLLGLRKSQLGNNTWGLPGGKLDFAEDLKECAKRELKEETNLDIDISDLKLIGVSNAVFDEETHYITVIYETRIYSNVLMITEPDKCERWEWFTFDNLPENLFLPFKNFVKDL